jgi:hypothetical protein
VEVDPGRGGRPVENNGECDQPDGKAAHKCCDICSVAKVINDVAAIPVAFSYSSVAFRVRAGDLDRAGDWLGGV